MSSIINKSKWIVTVKRRPDLTRALGTLEQHIKDGVLPSFVLFTPSPTVRVGVRLDLLKSAPAELL